MLTYAAEETFAQQSAPITGPTEPVLTEPVSTVSVSTVFLDMLKYWCAESSVPKKVRFTLKTTRATRDDVQFICVCVCVYIYI